MRRSARGRGLTMDAPKAAYRAVTRQIEVTATPRFLPERSSPENGYFFWAYTITLTNRGAETVQLKTRHWRITDALGRLQEVRGAGVIGARRKFRIYERRAADHALRFHDRNLRHGDRRRGAIRHRHSGLLARHPAARANDQLTRSHEAGRRQFCRTRPHADGVRSATSSGSNT